MGVTIHHRLAQRKAFVKDTLDLVQGAAEQLGKEQTKIFNIPVEVKRKSDTLLIIDIGGCESLVFDFNPMKDYEKEEGWEYRKATLVENKVFKLFDEENAHNPDYPEFELLWTSSFTKTQFADNILEHQWVAELTRLVASRCVLAEVHDEGDYYHSGKIEDAAEAIGETGKMIEGIGKQLSGLGFESIIKGGETTITSKKQKHEDQSKN